MSRTEAGEPAPAGGVLALLRRSRVLQVFLVVVIAANLAESVAIGLVPYLGGEAEPQVTAQAAEGSRK